MHARCKRVQAPSCLVWPLDKVNGVAATTPFVSLLCSIFSLLLPLIHPQIVYHQRVETKGGVHHIGSDCKQNKIKTNSISHEDNDEP